MEAGHERGEIIDLRKFRRAARNAVRYDGVGRKAVHLHGVLDDGAVRRERGLVGAAADGDDVEVEFRRQAAVEPQFFQAGQPAGLERGEIEKAQVDWFLDLPGPVARQQNP